MAALQRNDIPFSSNGNNTIGIELDKTFVSMKNYEKERSIFFTCEFGITNQHKHGMKSHQRIPVNLKEAQMGITLSYSIINK